MSDRVRSGGVVLRLWVEAVLVDEETVHTPGASEVVAERHQHLIAQAERDDKVWMAEVYDDTDSGLEEDQRYLRWGTDAAGMRAPQAASAAELVKAGEAWASGKHGTQTVTPNPDLL